LRQISSNRGRNLTNDIGPFEMLQARQLIESNVAEAVAWQIGKADIAVMQQTLDNERVAIQNNVLKDDNDKKFHLLIAEATQNSVLIEIVTMMWQQRENSPMWQQLHKRIINDGYRMLWVDEHQQILNALKRKSPTQAKRAMWEHLEHVRNKLFELSDTDNPDFDGFLFPIPSLIKSVEH
ncbi:MAG: FCD domain-containing protein, partial [Ostreibacterium sp.]